MPSSSLTAVLLLSCRDRVGLVSRISHFIFERGGNILDLDEHVDQEAGMFFIRVSWDMAGFSIAPDDLKDAFAPLAKEFGANWQIKFLQEPANVAIMVSKYDHCLNEILWRDKIEEFNIQIKLIISNHPNLEYVARQHNIPYYCIPITKETKVAREKEEIELLKEHEIDTLILARYMQILSPTFVEAFPNKIINIHHSFLPAFVGGNPYKQAYERGVKIIGATSHYVTEDLDEGPIIEQDIMRVSHKDSLKDMVRKGRDLERLVLARALHNHFQHRVLVHGHKTIVFE
jgi:formyltetrahydrofolate deformylase